MRPWSVLALAAMSLAACSVEAGRADVPGTYVMNHGRAADTLWIRPGGTYRHSYGYPGRPATVRHGTWTWSNFASIEVDDFVMHSRRESFPEAFRAQGGTWPAGVDRSLVTGAIFIPVDEDTGWAYVRVSAELLGSGGG